MNGRGIETHGTTRLRLLAALPMLLLAGLSSGCYSMAFPYAPVKSPAIEAEKLPDSFRTPYKQFAPKLNLASLTDPPDAEYTLGPGDILDITIPGLFRESEVEQFRVQITETGRIHLPLVGSVDIGGLTLSTAHEAINKAYADGFLAKPQVIVTIFQKGTIDVVVLGQVNTPGVVRLPRDTADVGHAIAGAAGLNEFADDLIEVHRRVGPGEVAPADMPPPPDMAGLEGDGGIVQSAGSDLDPKVRIDIPLRGHRQTVYTSEGVVVRAMPDRQDVRLESGDVVKVPRRVDEPFFVVGPLSRSNVVNFSVRNRDRQLGNAFLLPNDRDIDVVTAVAMAGYIDPIESPTTVTVQRQVVGGDPLLIRVNLFDAREDWRENVLIEPGDIVYLNPDIAWYSRLIFNRVVGSLITLPYDFALNK